jgi:hypothetical protein
MLICRCFHAVSLEIVHRLTLEERAISPCVSLPALRRLIALLLLMRGERRLAAKPDAVRHGAGSALASAGADQFALELGKPA